MNGISKCSNALIVMERCLDVPMFQGCSDYFLGFFYSYLRDYSWNYDEEIISSASRKAFTDLGACQEQL